MFFGAIKCRKNFLNCEKIQKLPTKENIFLISQKQKTSTNSKKTIQNPQPLFNLNGMGFAEKLARSQFLFATTWWCMSCGLLNSRPKHIDCAMGSWGEKAEKLHLERFVLKLRLVFSKGFKAVKLRLIFWRVEKGWRKSPQARGRSNLKPGIPSDLLSQIPNFLYDKNLKKSVTLISS